MTALCAVEDCPRHAEARGWCGLHYERWRKHGDPLLVKPTSTQRTGLGRCSIAECDAVDRSRGMCSIHYRRWLRSAADPEVLGRTRFESCVVEGCEREAGARGWCLLHYQRWHKTGDPLGLRPGLWSEYVRPRCSVDGCDKFAHARGLCQVHFPRMRRHGNPEFITRTPNGTPFWDLVNVTLACWLWLGGKTTAGYGQWRDDSGQAVYAHRWVLNLTGSGLPPDNMHAHHECLNTSCVNPDHLLVLTPKEHRQRHREMRLAVLQQTGSPR